MKRRPLLYVINFLLPIGFFLTLDLASFFIADHRGEKLGFKVTVLLAISVLLLILNDILPSMSNKTPVIGTDASGGGRGRRLPESKGCSALLLLSPAATYCIVIFALMLLSLLETILVTHLMDKTSQEKLWEASSWEDKREKGDGGRRRSGGSRICSSDSAAAPNHSL